MFVFSSDAGGLLFKGGAAVRDHQWRLRSDCQGNQEPLPLSMIWLNGAQGSDGAEEACAGDGKSSVNAPAVPVATKRLPDLGLFPRPEKINQALCAWLGSRPTLDCEARRVCQPSAGSASTAIDWSNSQSRGSASPGSHRSDGDVDGPCGDEASDAGTIVLDEDEGDADEVVVIEDDDISAVIELSDSDSEPQAFPFDRSTTCQKQNGNKIALQPHDNCGLDGLEKARLRLMERGEEIFVAFLSL